MPSVLATRPDIRPSCGAAYQYAARRAPRDCDVGVERVAAGAERLPGDDVDAQPPSDRHVEVARKRRAPRVRLHLDIVPCQGNAIEPEPGQARHHCWARPVLEHEAQAVFFRAYAGKAAKTPHNVPEGPAPRPR